MFLMRIQALPFLFLFAYMPFVLFCACEIFLQKKKKFQTALMTSFTLLLWSHSLSITNLAM